MTTTRSEWVPAFMLDEVPVGEARLFSHEDRRIAVFRTDAERAWAVDNRCPHEGYPLVRGYVKDCVVTCIWHNFKFDLRDGRCVMGDEHVRAYPLRITAGRIELDLTDPDPAEEVARLHASLERGLLERKLGQIARDIVRLLQLGTLTTLAPAGTRPADIVLVAARFDADHADYGTTHALPVAADTLTIAARYPGVAAVLPLIQAFDLASESHQRRPRRPTPAPIDPGDDPLLAGARLRDAVEAEDAATAEALLRGALELRGWPRDVVEPWLFRVCTDHFLDFGHALIYQIKIFDLLAQIGWQHAPALLPAHLFRIIHATREELVPEWRWLCNRLAADEPQFVAWLARNGDRPQDPAASSALAHALLDGPRDVAFDALARALADGVGLRNLADALLLAGAGRLARFDPAIDADPTVQEGWLDVTHRFTFARAVDCALARHASPDVLRLVYFAAHFIHVARGLDVPQDRRPAIVPAAVPAEPGAAAEAVLRAIQQRDPDAAVALAAGYLAAAHPIDVLRVALEDAALRDPAARPIFVAHVIKTCISAFEAHAALADHPDRARPILAFVRYFAVPAHERALARLAHEAIGFVVEGKVPRTMT